MGALNSTTNMTLLFMGALNSTTNMTDSTNYKEATTHKS